jgi:hypothetical protein
MSAAESRPRYAIAVSYPSPLHHFLEKYLIENTGVISSVTAAYRRFYRQKIRLLNPLAL